MNTTLALRDASHAGGILWPAGKLPPAALATKPSADVSDRYQFISTAAVVEMMSAEGFEVASSSARRRRDSSTASPTGQHVVDFRHPDAAPIYGTVPRLLFVNSHDGSRAASVSVGAFRLVCSNGLVTGTVLASAKVRHSGDAARDLVERMRQLSKNSLPMFQQIERWTKKQLTRGAAHEYARLAAQLRWGRPGVVTTDALLDVRRAEDDAGDLWTVFNRVQEAATSVSLSGTAASGRRIATKPLLEIGPNMRFNSDLWRLTEEFAEM
jgi:hypothetical protein